MRAQEIVRIVIMVVIGASTLFFIQPLLYLRRIISLGDVSPEQWIENAYTPASILIFTVSLAATGSWYIFASKANLRQSKDTFSWRLLWWVIFLGPVLSVLGGLYICRSSSDALISLTLMYTADILLMYWVTTAISSPGHTKFLPPGSFTMRSLLGD